MAKKTFVLQAAIFSALRRLFRRWPHYAEILKRAKEEYFLDSKKGTKVRRVRFICEKCQKKVSRKECAIDHIEPVIDPNTGFKDYNTYIERLFCDINGLQLLCKQCHNEKTKLENKKRREKQKKTKKKSKSATK